MDSALSLEALIASSVVSWITIPEDAVILCIEDRCELTLYFRQRRHFVDTAIQRDKSYTHAFVLDRNADLSELLPQVMDALAEDGTLYLGADNSTGLRFFCGDTASGKTYSKAEIEALLENAGFCQHFYYSVLPNNRCAQLVYAEDYTPEESLSTRFIPMYEQPRQITRREEILFDKVNAGGMFHRMANSYLVECRKSDFGKTEHIRHATLSPDRGEGLACITKIYSDRVEKLSMCEAGKERISNLISNDEYLRQHGVKVVDSSLVDGVYTMPYIHAESLVFTMQRLLRTDTAKFLECLDRFRDTVLHSSECTYTEDGESILKRCYLDLIPLNCFYYRDDFLFYDQEFFVENESANLILLRAIIVIYNDDRELDALYPMEKLWSRYGMTAKLSEYAAKERHFIRTLRNMDLLSNYNNRHYASPAHIADNGKSTDLAEIQSFYSDSKENICK